MSTPMHACLREMRRRRSSAPFLIVVTRGTSPRDGRSCLAPGSRPPRGPAGSSISDLDGHPADSAHSRASCRTSFESRRSMSHRRTPRASPIVVSCPRAAPTPHLATPCSPRPSRLEAPYPPALPSPSPLAPYPTRRAEPEPPRSTLPPGTPRSDIEQPDGPRGGREPGARYERPSPGASLVEKTASNGAGDRLRRISRRRRASGWTCGVPRIGWPDGGDEVDSIRPTTRGTPHVHPAASCLRQVARRPQQARRAPVGYTRSKIIADPMPPAAQAEISPNCASFCAIWSSSCSTRRPPVAPNG